SRPPRQDSDVIAAAVLLTYLISSISFTFLIGRAYGVDLRLVGSRKLGGSNLAKSVGFAQGTLGGLLDAAKGFAAVIIARAVGLPIEAQLLCGVTAVIGQMWPVFHRFDGGRANATGWGFALAADPIAAFIMGVPLYFVLATKALVRPTPSRLWPLASLLSFAVFPAVIWEGEGVIAAVVAGLRVLALVLVRRI